MFCQIEASWFFLLMHQNLGVIFCVYKISVWSQKYSVFPPDANEILPKSQRHIQCFYLYHILTTDNKTLSSWRKYGKFWKVCLKSLLDSDYEKQLSTKHEHWLFVYKYTFSKLYVFPIELWSDNLKPFRKLVRNAVLYSRRSMQFYFYNWNIFKKHDFKKPH